MKDYFELEPNGEFLQSLVGVVTPVGVVASVPGAGDAIARITVVPEPASLSLLGVATLTMLRRRR